jgi:hypothetical protein
MPVAIPVQGSNSTHGQAANRLAMFRGWDYFGRIRSTSDHLALYIEV